MSHESIAKCIRETGNWSGLSKEHKFDNPEFDPKRFQQDLAVRSPKLHALLERIKKLDEEDLKNNGMVFKHFIYSDVQSGYGAKLIASGLASAGFKHAYALKKGARGMGFQLDVKGSNTKRFATLTSTTFFERNIGVNFRRELLKTFNARPDNTYGDKIRIIILDSGFREGVDLFDIKYVHLFEPIPTVADQKQAIGRATRYCGQKGLRFDTKRGWPIHVYQYETTVPDSIRDHLVKANKTLAPAQTTFDLFMRFSNLDPKKITLANELEKVAIMGAVDRSLTKRVHRFSLARDDTEPDYYHKIFNGGQANKQASESKLSKYQRAQAMIRKDFSHYAWPPTKVENGCEPKKEALGNNKQQQVLSFTPTQDFVRHYFTADTKQKGMLLFHSVGTGKTCTAIATASTTFEPKGYTVVYVTRHTLRADVWKNMFDQACSIMIQDMIKAGIHVPEDKTKRTKLISRRWIEPMSYKQFSNMIKGKNALYQELVKRNGKEDPLHKTLIIIDEAHKLYAPDVSGSEKPDVEAIKSALQRSYHLSGQESARVLLMTATPYTEDPLDMMRLLNLMRAQDKELPESFDAFSQAFLDENGHFTQHGMQRFLNAIAGDISYLNREMDIRSFAYPIFHKVNVPMSDYEVMDMVKEFDDLRFKVKHEADVLGYAVMDRANIARDVRQAMEDGEYKDKIIKETQRYEKCMHEQHEHMKKKRGVCDQEHQSDLATCEAQQTECKTQVKAKYKADQDALKQAFKQRTKDECKRGNKVCREEIKHKLKTALEQLKEEFAFDLNQCSQAEDYKMCREAAEAKFAACLKDVTRDVKENPRCKEILDGMKRMREDLDKRIEEAIQSRLVRVDKEISFDQKRMIAMQKSLGETQKRLHDGIKADRSQRAALDKCLSSQKVKPAYEPIIKGKESPYLGPDPETREGVEDLKNIFIINGHGSEFVTDISQRHVMPKGQVLVVFPVCSRPNWTTISCRFMGVFDKPANRKYLANPIKYKKRLERMFNAPIRIYLPGDRVPQLSTNLFGNFAGQRGVIVLEKSGVYRMGKIPPIDREIMTAHPRGWSASPDCQKFTGIIQDPSEYRSKIHHEVFKGNLYNPVRSLAGYHAVSARTFTLRNIMDSIGPGVYYHMGCRSSNTYDQLDESEYERILEDSQKQQDAEGRDTRSNSVSKYLKHAKENSASPGYIKTPTPELTPNSSSSKSRSRSKSKQDGTKNKDQPELDKEEPKVKEPKAKISKQDQEKMRSIHNVLREMKASLAKKEDVDVESTMRTLVEMKTFVSMLPKGAPGVALAARNIDVLIDMLKDEDAQMTLELKVSKTGRYYSLYLAQKRNVDGKKVTLLETYFALIPTNMRDTSHKCSSETLIHRIKTLHKRGLLHKVSRLPTQVKDWEDPELFSRLCHETREALFQ